MSMCSPMFMLSNQLQDARATVNHSCHAQQDSRIEVPNGKSCRDMDLTNPEDHTGSVLVP